MMNKIYLPLEEINNTMDKNLKLIIGVDPATKADFSKVVIIGCGGVGKTNFFHQMWMDAAKAQPIIHGSERGSSLKGYKGFSDTWGMRFDKLPDFLKPQPFIPKALLPPHDEGTTAEFNGKKVKLSKPGVIFMDWAEAERSVINQISIALDQQLTTQDVECVDVTNQKQLPVANNWSPCPECGGPMMQTEAGDECTQCSYSHYYH